MDLFARGIDTCLAGIEIIQNSYDLNSLTGPADTKSPLRYAFEETWDLPMGKAHRFAYGDWDPTLFSGWQADAIHTAQDGYPFVVSLSFDNTTMGTATSPTECVMGGCQGRR